MGVPFRSAVADRCVDASREDGTDPSREFLATLRTFPQLVRDAPRRRRGDVTDANPRVDGARTGREHLQRVDIELQDLRTRVDEGGDAKENVSKRMFVRARRAAIPAQ